MFIKQKIQTRSISGHSNKYSAMPTPQSQTINAIWDINQIGQELDCNDDPILNEAIEYIYNKQVNQAILLLNQMVSDAKKYLGQQSQVQLVTKVTLLVVSSAMSILENDPASALLLLLGCDQMFKGLTPKQQGYLRVQIQNGLGCYYRRVGQLEKALKELECALALIKKYALKEVAVTHLNLSVVLSLIEEHEGALENAKKAVTESHKEYQYYIKNHVSMSQFKFQRCVSSLAISFYNVGVQEQHFQRYQFALQAYASAYKVAEDNLGIYNYLTIQLKSIYEEFARQLAIAEAQKIAITSLNHKFQIKANITSQYAQSALRNQPQDTAKKVTERLFQSETKRLGHPLRPQSAVSNSSTKLKQFEVTRKEGFTIKKQLSATNRTINQVSEENAKTDILKTDFEAQEKAKELQENIEALKTQAQREQEELKRIQEQKQKELQKLEAFRYMNTQIQQQQKLQRNTPQTSREMKQSSESKQMFNTDPLIQEELNESEPQPLVAIQAVRESKTEVEEEEKVLFSEKPNNEIIKNQEKKRMSLATTQEQKGCQDETQQSLTKKLDFEQESQNRITSFQQQLSCKQIDDLEEITDDFNNQQNNQIIEQEVEEIINQKAQQLEEEQRIQAINLIQTQWKKSHNQLQNRIERLKKPYSHSQFQKYLKLNDEQNQIHNGYLIFGVNDEKIDIIFLDLYILRKSARKCVDSQQKLQHILILSITSTLTHSEQQLSQLVDEIIPFLAIEQFQLKFKSNDTFHQFKEKEGDRQIRLDFLINKIDYIKIEELQQNYSTPLTLADIQQFNSDSIVVQKAAHTTPDSIFNKVEPFQDVPYVEEKIDELEKSQEIKDDSKSEKNSNHYSQNSFEQQNKEQSEENEKVNQTGQFNNQIFSSQQIQSQQDLDTEENNLQKPQQVEVGQNLDFTLHENNNSITGSITLTEEQQTQILPTLKEKPSANNTIIEEDEDERREEEQKESIQSQNSIHQTAKNTLSKQSSPSQTSIEDKHEPLQVPLQDKLLKQPSLQLPDLMKDDISSQQEISLTQPNEKIGTITGVSKIDGTLILINIFISREQELFQAKVEDVKAKPVYFKVENVEKTIKKPQKYLKGYIVNWKNETVLKVYTKRHEKAVIKLQKKFKLDHYRRSIGFKLAKSHIEGVLFVGFRKGVIYLAIETKQTQHRNSYTFRNENYSQFVKRISFRILNNLKYSDQNGIYLLQEPEHRILAQNLQAKIFKLLKPENAFEFVGFGLLNGIYDSVHKKIIIASDNRKTQPSQIDIPKSLQGEQLLQGDETLNRSSISSLNSKNTKLVGLVQFAQNLLDRSFIIQFNHEQCVVYYEEKDEDYVKMIQQKIFQYQTVRRTRVNFHRVQNGRVIAEEIEVELQRKLKRYYRISCFNQFFEIGKLSDAQIKRLLTNFRKITCTFLRYQDLDIESIKEFLDQGQFINLLRMDLKDIVYQI